VDKLSDLAVAAGHGVDVAGWRHVLDQVLGTFAGRFARVATRRAAAGFVTGLQVEGRDLILGFPIRWGWAPGRGGRDGPGPPE
jgi:hypothetical protein